VDTIQTPLYRKARCDITQKITAVVIVGLLVLTGIVASVRGTDSMLMGQLVPEKAGEVSVPTSKERNDRFELIIQRTHEQYTELHSLIALDIEKELEQQLHGSAPDPQEQLKTLREQRWQQDGAWWEFMLDEFARWFGLTR
jgi:hypothetical protein